MQKLSFRLQGCIEQFVQQKMSLNGLKDTKNYYLN